MRSVYLLVARAGGDVLVQAVDAVGAASAPSRRLEVREFPGFVRDAERNAPRWVWEDTASIYPVLLAAELRRIA
jgi:DNA polymerase I